MCDSWRSGGVTLILTLFILIEQITLKTWRSCLICNDWEQNKTSQVCLYRSEMICLKHERSWLTCPTTEVVRLSSFIHSDRADCLENMKELPYMQWLKVWKVRCLSEWIKNALYEQNVLSSHGLHRSTFGDERLNYRVRNGIGWSLSLWFRSYKAFSLYEPNIWSYQVTNFAHPEGYIALWVKITNRKEIIKIKSSTN